MVPCVMSTLEAEQIVLLLLGKDIELGTPDTPLCAIQITGYA